MMYDWCDGCDGKEVRDTDDVWTGVVGVTGRR